MEQVINMSSAAIVTGAFRIKIWTQLFKTNDVVS